MANQSPTITSCKFTDSLAPGPYPPGSKPVITVVAQSLNSTDVEWAVPVEVTDTEVEGMDDIATASATREVFNALAAAINDDPAGYNWTIVPGSASQTSPGVYTCELTTQL